MGSGNDTALLVLAEVRRHSPCGFSLAASKNPGASRLEIFAQGSRKIRASTAQDDPNHDNSISQEIPVDRRPGRCTPLYATVRRMYVRTA